MRRGLLFLSLLGLAFGLCLRTPAQTSIGVTPDWLQYLGDGEGGAYSCTSGICYLTDEKWVSSFNVSAGAIAVSGSSDGPIIIRSPGTCTVAGTISNSPNTGGGGGINVYGDFGGGAEAEAEGRLPMDIVACGLSATAG